MNAAKNLESHLSQHFALKSFRKGQKEVILGLLQGLDTLMIMPTGGGKSLCYQFTAHYLGGLSIVVSPLISLMRDQTHALQAKNIAAGAVHSGNTAEENYHILKEAFSSKNYILYMSPERLQNDAFLERVESHKISLFAIDEAHCISQWGHDFRPNYTKLQQLKKIHPNTPILGSTATATPAVIKDICKRLALKNPIIKKNGFYRKNLFYQSQLCLNNEQKDSYLKQAFRKFPDDLIIVYSSTRKMCQELFEKFNAYYPNMNVYHAGLTTKERSQIQDDFSKGQIKILFATNAFGMGVDQPNVRMVIHYNLPSNLESYYQEVGRAGRDGKHSSCLLLHSKQDMNIQTFFIEKSNAPEDIIQSKWNALDTIQIYSKDKSCRHHLILKYFKDDHKINHCGHCDNCSPSSHRMVRHHITRKKTSPNLPANPSSQLILKKLKHWRKTYAEERQIPPFSVIGNKALEQISQNPPQNKNDFKSLKALNDQQVYVFGPQILRVIKSI